MPEKPLEFNQLEARGLFLVQSNVLDAAQKAAQAAKMLEAMEAEAVKVLDGRVPAGVTIRNLRIDQVTGRVYAPDETPPAQASP